MQRYTGKPFLRLLECYVLWSIGELAPKDEQKLVDMTPKLGDVYKRRSSWHEIVASEMEFPADLPQHIRALWQKSKQSDENGASELHAEDFAQMFVDENLVNR